MTLVDPGFMAAVTSVGPATAERLHTDGGHAVLLTTAGRGDITLLDMGGHLRVCRASTGTTELRPADARALAEWLSGWAARADGAVSP